MAETSDSSTRFPVNIGSILALLTLIGSAWLVSHKLTSDRPVAPAGAAEDFMGEQRLEARLWEDPFKVP